MAIGIVQTGFIDNSTSLAAALATTVTMGVAPTSMNLLLVFVGFYQNGVSPSAPGSFPTLALSGSAVGFSSHLVTPVGTAIGSPLFDRIGVSCFYAYATGSGSNVTVTATNLGGWGGGSDSEISVGVYEVSGSDLSPVSGTAGGGGPDSGPLPAQYAIGTGKHVFSTLAATDDTPGYIVTVPDYESGKFSFANKSVTPSTNDAIQISSAGGGMIFGQCQIIISEPVVPTPSLRPFGPFARIPASHFTR